MSDLSIEEQDILAKLGDRDWRLHNLYYVKDKAGRRVKFVPNEVQEYILANSWYLTLILKSRQHGVTTFFCLLYLDACLFTPNQRAGIIAQTEPDAREIFASKIKFAYDNLPADIKEHPMYKNVVDRQDKLEFGNGSSLYVDCSMRSTTLQYLHISEFGKICAKFPDRAREIVSGALNTVAVGQYISIESTAEGSDGAFFDMCQESLHRSISGTKPHELQFRFMFFGWYCDSGNVLEADKVVLTKADKTYFEIIEPEIRRMSDSGVIMPMPNGILSDDQKSWYIAKLRQQGDSMNSEFPSTPDEAFSSTAEGLYYRREMAYLYENKRIGRVPWNPGYMVDTFWDFGGDNYTAIWFHQKIGQEHRMIDFVKDYGKGFAYYVNMMTKKGYTYGKHYIPHDGTHKRQGYDVELKSSEMMLGDLGLKHLVLVPRTSDVTTAIETTKQFLVQCWFDEENCTEGLKCLSNYRREWDDRKSRWRDHPYHDPEYSDGADAFRTGAMGFATIQKQSAGPRRKRPGNGAFY